MPCAILLPNNQTCSIFSTFVHSFSNACINLHPGMGDLQRDGSVGVKSNRAIQVISKKLGNMEYVIGNVHLMREINHIE